MKTTRHTLIIIFFSVTSYVFCQNEADHWYFGNSCGIDFTTNSPQVIHDSQMDSHWEGTVSVSHPVSSELLFYSNGINIWDKQHNIMPNGDSLGGDNSSTMILAVPFPNNPNKYYLFTTQPFGGSVKYSVVNMDLNSGLGDIESGMKNILLQNISTEKISATKNQNNDGYWLLTLSGNMFRAYEITSGGISTPVMSLNVNTASNKIGYMKFNHSGDKIVSLNYDINATRPLEMFDFDNSTGLVSNQVTLSQKSKLYGAEFSPDDSKLYVSFVGAPTIQYDLQQPTLSDIQNSETSLNYNDGAIQLASDGKIYIANQFSNFLDAITFPNLPGLSCLPVEDAVDLGSAECRLGLPNFVQSIFDETTGIDHFEKPTDIIIYPNPCKGILTINSKPDIKMVVVTNMNGVTVKTVRDTKGIDLSDLSPGYYILEIETNQGTIYKKPLIHN